MFKNVAKLEDGTPVTDIFDFHIRRVEIKEVLETDLRTMVMAEVTEAYSNIKVPCIVEHAGLIFDEYRSYPGGLTKPMWDFLGEKFIKRRVLLGGRSQLARSLGIATVTVFTRLSVRVLEELPTNLAGSDGSTGTQSLFPMNLMKSPRERPTQKSFVTEALSTRWGSFHNHRRRC